mgnify:FL=1
MQLFATLQYFPPPQDGFINIQLELPGDRVAEDEAASLQLSLGEGRSLHHSLSDMAEAELAEADQGTPGGGSGEDEGAGGYLLPEGASFPVRDSEPSPIQPAVVRPSVFSTGAMAGLDRWERF